MAAASRSRPVRRRHAAPRARRRARRARHQRRGRRCCKGTASSGSTSAADGVVAGIEGLGTIAARYVVAADGMWSPDAQGARARRRRATSASGTPSASTSTASPARPRDQLIVWFDADLLPGYAWSFPLPGRSRQRRLRRPARRHGTAYAGHEADCGRRSSTGRTSPPPSARVRRPRTGTWRGRSRPRIDRATLPHGPVLFAGDAAAATDVMTGEGIGQALLTGRLAAEAIVGRRAGRRGAAGYRHAVRGELVADHRMSVLLGRVLARRRGADGAIAHRSPTPATGAAATSPAGCSRTSPERSRSPPAAGTGGSCVARAPSHRHAREPGGGLPSAVMRTRLTELLDIEHPVMLAGMGGVSLPPPGRRRVSEAGGIGTLGASTMRADELAEEMAAVRELTAKPFGVDLLTALPGQVEAGHPRRHRRRRPHLRRRPRRAP